MSTEPRRTRDLHRLGDDLGNLERVGSGAVGRVEGATADAWQSLMGREGYLPVLLLIFASMISIPLLGDYEPWGGIFNVLLACVALVVTVFRSTQHPVTRRVVGTFMVATAAGAIAATLLITDDPDGFPVLSFLLNVAYLMTLLVAFPLVLMRSFRHRRVTINTVCANLSAYLLIGLIFMALYRLMGNVSAPFFSQFSGGGRPTAGQYAYFSFVTLTTVGYGDLTPFSDVGRSAVMVEAVVGQVFLVTTMARVVSLLGEERQSRSLRLGPLRARIGTDTASDPAPNPGPGPAKWPTGARDAGDASGHPDAPAPDGPDTMTGDPGTTVATAGTSTTSSTGSGDPRTARRTSDRELVRRALIDGWNGDPPDDW